MPARRTAPRSGVVACEHVNAREKFENALRSRVHTRQPGRLRRPAVRRAGMFRRAGGWRLGFGGCGLGVGVGLEGGRELTVRLRPCPCPPWLAVFVTRLASRVGE